MCIWILTCYIWQTTANTGSVKQGTHLWDKISYTPTRPSSVPKPSHPSLLGCHANCGNKRHNTHSQFLDTVFILCYCPTSTCFLSLSPHTISVWKNPWLIQKKKKKKKTSRRRVEKMKIVTPKQNNIITKQIRWEGRRRWWPNNNNNIIMEKTRQKEIMTQQLQ